MSTSPSGYVKMPQIRGLPGSSKLPKNLNTKSAVTIRADDEKEDIDELDVDDEEIYDENGERIIDEGRDDIMKTDMQRYGGRNMSSLAGSQLRKHARAVSTNQGTYNS